MRFIGLLSAAFCLLCVGCASSPEKPSRPSGMNIEITRPTVQAKILAETAVTVLWGHVPLLALRDGETHYGNLELGTYHLKAVSPDPYRFSDYSAQTWESRPFDLVVEKGKNYKLQIVPGPEQGWEIRQVPAD